MRTNRLPWYCLPLTTVATYLWEYWCTVPYRPLPQTIQDFDYHEQLFPWVIYLLLNKLSHRVEQSKLPSMARVLLIVTYLIICQYPRWWLWNGLWLPKSKRTILGYVWHDHKAWVAPIWFGWPDIKCKMLLF
jgi:hypothetical protein